LSSFKARQTRDKMTEDSNFEEEDHHEHNFKNCWFLHLLFNIINNSKDKNINQRVFMNSSLKSWKPQPSAQQKLHSYVLPSILYAYIHPTDSHALANTTSLLLSFSFLSLSPTLSLSSTLFFFSQLILRIFPPLLIDQPLVPVSHCRDYEFIWLSF